MRFRTTPQVGVHEVDALAVPREVRHERSASQLHVPAELLTEVHVEGLALGLLLDDGDGLREVLVSGRLARMAPGLDAQTAILAEPIADLVQRQTGVRECERTVRVDTVRSDLREVGAVEAKPRTRRCVRVMVRDPEQAAFLLARGISAIVRRVVDERPEKLREATFRDELVDLVLAYVTGERGAATAR